MQTDLSDGRLCLDTNGNVGIGTLAPSSALEVNGTVKATSFAGDGSGLVNLPAPAVNWVQINGLSTVITMTKPLDSCTNAKPAIGCFVILASANFSVSTTATVVLGLQLYDGSTMLDSAYQTVSSSNGSVSLNWVMPVTAAGGTEVFRASVYASDGGTILNSHNLTVMFFPKAGN